MMMINKICILLNDFRQNNAGVTAVYFALSIPIFMGFAGLSFDTALWFMERRVLQNTVDSAAIAAAQAIKFSKTSAVMIADAETDAATNGFSVGGSNYLSINNPPIAGLYVADADAVRAELTTTVDGFFSKFFGYDDLTVTTVATAKVFTSAGNDGCIMALHETAAAAVNFTGSSAVTLSCGVLSNSNSSSSISLNGSTTVSADGALTTNGNVYQGGNSTLSSSTKVNPNAGPIDDPYEHLTIPDTNTAEFPECAPGGDKTNYTFPNNAAGREADPFYQPASNTFELKPGRYCGGLNMTMNSSTKGKVKFLPGTYIMDAGDFNIGSQALVIGEGVTIILTADNPADIGQFDVNGGAGVTLTAQTTDQVAGTIVEDYAGILMYQDRRATYESNANKINGGSELNISGVVYFPSQNIDFQGNSSLANTCTRVVGSTVTLTGNTDFTINNDPTACSAFGITPSIPIKMVALVE